MPPSTTAVLFDEASLSLSRKRARTALSMAGVALGVAALTTTIALGTTAAAAINGAFDAREALTVQVSEQPDGLGSVFPVDAVRRSMRIDGATAAMARWDVPVADVRSHFLAGRSAAPVVAVDPASFEYPGLAWRTGVPFGTGSPWHGSRVAVLGALAAYELGVETVSSTSTLMIGGVQFQVVGVLGESPASPDLLTSVMIPVTTTRALWGDGSLTNPRLTELTQLGAPAAVASQLPVALAPEAAQRIVVREPYSASGLRREVVGSTVALYLALGVVSLVVSAFGIANSMLVAVLERRAEIGLRRAVGARPRHILVQFFVEAATLGTVGGLMGVALGICATVAIAAARGWSPVLDVRVALAGVLLGALVGAIGGAVPALRATRIEAADALRL